MSPIVYCLTRSRLCSTKLALATQYLGCTHRCMTPSGNLLGLFAAKRRDSVLLRKYRMCDHAPHHKNSCKSAENMSVGHGVLPNKEVVYCPTSDGVLLNKK